MRRTGIVRASWTDTRYAGQKSYAKQTVYDAHLTSKKHIKAAEKLEAGGAAANGKATADESKSAAATQHNKIHRAALLTKLTETLLMTSPVPTLLSDSKQNTERKSALTAKEREQELEDAAQEKPVANEAKEGEEDDDGRIYNPLKLPLGWDGKPIPYWLYKLHGLGVEYKCEICSDFVYMGRLAMVGQEACDCLLMSLWSRFAERLSIAISRNLDTPSVCALLDCPTPSTSTRSLKFQMPWRSPSVSSARAGKNSTRPIGRKSLRTPKATFTTKRRMKISSDKGCCSRAFELSNHMPLIFQVRTQASAPELRTVSSSCQSTAVTPPAWAF